MDHLVIEIMMLIITIASVIVALLSLYHSNKHFLKSIEPLISVNLKMSGNNLSVAVTNTGGTPALNLSIEIDSIKDENEEVYDKSQDGFSNKTFDLYPNETVAEPIGFFAESFDYSPDCKVTMKICY